MILKKKKAARKGGLFCVSRDLALIEAIGHDPARAGVVVDIVRLIEAVHRDASSRIARVDEFAVADIDAHVGDAVLVGVLEEDQVAGAQVALADRLAGVVLLHSGAGKLDSG